MSDLAKTYRELAVHASALERIITDVSALLEAIDQGELLSVLPPDEYDAKRHNTASYLLDIARRRLEDEQAIPGTDLSIKLHCMADKAPAVLTSAAA